MALPPIQYFRKEDFPEIASEGWSQRLFSKLNELARQTQYGIDNNLTVSQNLSGFWWEGIIGAFTKASGIVYPYVYDPAIPVISTKNPVSIAGFPFYIPNKLTPKSVKGVFVAQAFDVTNAAAATPLPAMAQGVAWQQEADRVKIYGIDGMVTGTSGSPGPGRCYQTRLLILSE